MTHEQIEKEFDEKFGYSTEEEIKEYKEQEFSRNNLSSAGCDNCSYNHFWRAEIKYFLKQSFIKYLQGEVDWLKTQYQDEHPVDCIDGETPVETYGYEETYNQSIKTQITHLQAQIKELQ